MEASDKKQVTLSINTLPKSTRKALSHLSQESWLKNDVWYLAGGTALALQCAHRKSVDLDFFTREKDFSVQDIENNLINVDWTTSLREKGTLYGILLGAKISFIAYPFFIPQQQYISYGSINVLDAKDIAVMKVLAISQRGKKRDFFDLYWYILNREPLINIVKRVNIQYPNIQHNYHHILKSLTYFEEAEDDPDPEIFFNANWEGIKVTLLEEAAKTAKDILKLS